MLQLQATSLKRQTLTSEPTLDCACVLTLLYKRSARSQADLSFDHHFLMKLQENHIISLYIISLYTI